MPRRAAEAAHAVAKPKVAAKKSRTTAANDLEAVKLAERRKQSHAAAVWAHANEKGSKAACKSGQFGDVTYNMVEPLLRELKANGKISAERDHHHQILTNEERRKLAEWILSCADGQDPKDRTQISAKVRGEGEGDGGGEIAEAGEEGSGSAGRRGAGGGLCTLRGGLRVRRHPLPMGQMEALPHVWAQERPVQGQGLLSSPRAALAGLQPGCGRAVEPSLFYATRPRRAHVNRIVSLVAPGV